MAADDRISSLKDLLLRWVEAGGQDAKLLPARGRKPEGRAQWPDPRELRLGHHQESAAQGGA